MQSPRMKRVLLRIFLFFFQSTALIALLPLVAREMHGGGPGTFTLLLGSMGAGAVAAALSVSRLRYRIGRDQFVRAGTLTHAAMAITVVLSPTLWLSVPAMAVAGMAWIVTANSLTLAAQMALPNWVRARGMSIYQMAIMGGSAGGATLWGYVAGFSSVRTGIICAAAIGVLLLLLTWKVTVDGGEDEDHSPVRSSGQAPSPFVEPHPDEGPVMVTVEYLIDPQRAEDFRAVMQETRRARLRQGALSWGLFRDSAAQGRYIEYFLDESWVEHLRRLERFTAADIGLRERRQAFHLGTEAPRVQRFLAEAVDGHGGGQGL
jgi:quinol monooxygenase YgiN